MLTSVPFLPSAARTSALTMCLRRRAARARHHQEVGVGGKRHEIGEVAIRHVLLAASRVRDLHAERLHARCDRLADATQPEDADALAREPRRELGTLLQPPARVHEAIEAHEAARRSS